MSVLTLNFSRCPDHSACVPLQRDQTILQAMMLAGESGRTACRNGGCGVCRLQLQQGQVTYRGKPPRGLWQEDLDAGVFLPCIAYPLTSITARPVSSCNPSNYSSNYSSNHE